MYLCCPPRDEAIPLLFTLSFLSVESSSGLSVSSAHLNVGVYAGSVIGILFILGCIAAFVGVNLAVCLYIAIKSKRRSMPISQNINVTAESRPILMSSIQDEVDRPGDTTPPVSEEERSEKEKTEAAMEKEREAMEEEGEQRYQPQEAIIGAPSTDLEANGDIKDN